MFQSSAISFLAVLAAFVVVLGLWATAFALYIEGARRLAAVPVASLAAAIKGQEQLLAVVKNPVILAAVVTSATGVIVKLARP
jgi:hypothetical protein